MSNSTVVLSVPINIPNTNRIREALGSSLVEAYTKEALSEAIADAEILFGGWPTETDLRVATKLKWFQAFTAGVNMYPLSTMQELGIQLTNTRGAHGPQIAENVFSMMLGFAVGIPDMVRFQDKCVWKKTLLNNRKFELYGQTVLLIGLGAIGEAVAVRAQAFGMTVHGIRRTASIPSDNIDKIFAQCELHSALAVADHVVLSLPLTEATRGYFKGAEFDAMKSSAYIYNVGRGACIQRDSLFSALDNRKIAGAGLDVTDPEPLLPDDPHWAYSNVILSQHSSGDSPNLDGRLTDIFLNNLDRYQQGLPLINVIDFEHGY